MTETKEKPPPVWMEWRPPYAKHVLGRYTDRTRDPETGLYEPQTYEIVCEECNDRWGPAKCETGAVREHIARFALAAHLHRAPLAPFKKP